MTNYDKNKANGFTLDHALLFCKPIFFFFLLSFSSEKLLENRTGICLENVKNTTKDNYFFYIHYRLIPDPVTNLRAIKLTNIILQVSAIK